METVLYQCDTLRVKSTTCHTFDAPKLVYYSVPTLAYIRSDMYSLTKKQSLFIITVVSSVDRFLQYLA